MSIPKVSVIVWCFNHENYISECLQSIVEQECSFTFEILVHDDSSTDRSRLIIDRYCELYPNIVFPVYQSENVFSRGRMRVEYESMLKRSRGSYIAYCDGDDFWTDRHKLEKQALFLSENDSYALTFHDAVLIDPASNLLSKTYLHPAMQRDYDSDSLRAFEYQHILFGTLMHRKVFTQIPKDYEFIPNGDNFFPSLFAKFGGGKFQSDVGPLAYRQHATGEFSSLPELKRFDRDLRTRLLMIEYSLRNNPHDITVRAIEKALLPMVSMWHQRLVISKSTSSQ